MTTAARLRHRVVIQEEVVTRDGYGSEVHAWIDVAKVWASVDPLQGREYFAAQQVNAETTHRVKIRYRPGVTPKMRALFEGRVFEIKSILDPEERHRELHLMCVEVV